VRVFDGESRLEGVYSGEVMINLACPVTDVPHIRTIPGNGRLVGQFCKLAVVTNTTLRPQVGWVPSRKRPARGIAHKCQEVGVAHVALCFAYALCYSNARDEPQRGDVHGCP